MSAIAISISALKQAAPVTRLVGPERIFPVVAPQEQKPPYIVVNMTTEIVPQTLAGPVAYPLTLIQIDCVAKTATEAIQIGSAVVAGLGSITKQTIEGFPCVDISKAEADFTDFADNRSSFRRVIDFYVRWDP